MVSVTLEGLWMVADGIVDFRFFVKFHSSGPAIISSFWTLREHVSYASKKLLNKQKTSLTWWMFFLERLSMFSDRIVDSWFFVKFHRSWTAIIFSFWSLTEHVSYASKKLLIKQKTSSTWCVLLWKDYVWFLIELSIFDFSSNFIGRDMQYFTGFQLSQSMLVIHQKCS